MNKRIFAAILALALALALLPSTALAAPPDYVSINGIPYRSNADPGGTWKLTFRDYAPYNDALLELNDYTGDSIVAMNGDLTIQLDGTSSVTGGIGVNVVNGSLTVTGDGSLSATGSSYGIWVSGGNLIVDGGEVEGIVNAESGNHGVAASSIEVKNGGKLTGTSSGAIGVFASDNITVSGSSELNGTGTGEHTIGVNVTGSIAVSGSGKLTGISTNDTGVNAIASITVSGSGNLTGTSTNYVGILARWVVFNGGTITATGDIAILDYYDADDPTLSEPTDLSGSVAYVATANITASSTGAVPYVPANCVSYKYFHVEPVAPGGADIPKTGDTATPYLWAGLALLAIMGLLTNAALHRRKRHGG